MRSPTTPRNPSISRTRHLHRLRWLLWRLRFLIAVGAAATAIMLVISEVRPANTPTTPVVALRNAVPAGEPIAASDVHRIEMPTAFVPDDAYTSTDEVTGQPTALALSATTVLTHGLISGDEARNLAPAGSVIVPVRLSDATITNFVQVGDRVDLVLVPDGQTTNPETGGVEGPAAADTTTLAKRALILPPPKGEEIQESGLLSKPATANDSESFLLVAVSPKEAKVLTAAARSGYIGAVLVE